MLRAPRLGAARVRCVLRNHGFIRHLGRPRWPAPANGKWRRLKGTSDSENANSRPACRSDRRDGCFLRAAQAAPRRAFSVRRCVFLLSLRAARWQGDFLFRSVAEKRCGASQAFSRRQARKRAPYFASFFSPTPLTSASSSSVFGRSSHMPRSVLSEKMR